MEKLILVYYVAIDDMNSKDIDDYLRSLGEDFRNDEIIQYIIPIKHGESRIECLNPRLISEEDYKQAKELLERNQKIVDDLVKSFKTNE